MPLRRPLVVLLLWSLSAIAWAGAQQEWRVTALGINAPVAVGGWWYQGGSPLTRGLHVDGTYVALYAVDVFPGMQYTVQLSVPSSLQHIRAYLYDRWPLLAGARRVALPNGPLVVPPSAARFVYRWRVGIAARSSSNLLYLLLAYPRFPGRHSHWAPRIVVYAPPLLPGQNMGDGVTYLQGPRALVLSGSAPAVSYLLQPAEPVIQAAASPVWTPPGDLISNGNFRAGLKNWVPQIVSDAGRKAVNVDAGSLRLAPGGAVRQQLDADVAHAASLVLWTDLRLNTEPRSGTVAPALVIALCYHDVGGAAHCGNDARRIRFYPATAKATTNADTGARSARRIPTGRWFHFQADIDTLKPAPARLDSIALIAAGKAGGAQVRDIHLILRGDDDATK